MLYKWFLAFLCVGFLGGVSVAEEIKLSDTVATVTKPGIYNVTRAVACIKVQLGSASDVAHLKFFSTAADYKLSGSSTMSSAFRVAQGKVILEIQNGVTVCLSPYEKDETSYSTVALCSNEIGSLTIQGEGTLILHNTNGVSAIRPFEANQGSTNSAGSLILEGCPTVYCAATAGNAAIGPLETVEIRGGRLYCVPNCENVTKKPTQWKATETTDVLPIVAEEVKLAGGLLKGGLPGGNELYKTLIGSTGFTWTGGSYVTAGIEGYDVGGTLPGACRTLDGTSPCTGDFLADENKLVYLPPDSTERYAEGEKTIKDFFGCGVEPSETGMKATYSFGLLRVGPWTDGEGNKKVELDIGMDLKGAEEAENTRTLTISISETRDDTTTEVYKPTAVTFTRVKTGEPLFKATVQTTASFYKSTMGSSYYTVHGDIPEEPSTVVE